MTEGTATGIDDEVATGCTSGEAVEAELTPQGGGTKDGGRDDH